MTIESIVARWDEKLKEYGEERVAAFLEAEQIRRGLVYGDRPVCRSLRPLFFASEAADSLARDSEILRRAFGRLVASLPDRSDLQEALALRPEELRLMALDDPRFEPDLFGRLDAVLGEDGCWRFIEYNGESPGGLGYGDALGDVFESLPPFAELIREFRLERRPMRQLVVDQYIDRWRRARGNEVAPGARPKVLILDLPNPPTIGEFRVFQAAFEEAGCETRIGSPADLTFDGTTLRCAGQPVDLVYRRLLTADLIADPSMIDELNRAVKAGRVVCANGFGGYLYAHKGLMALLSDPASCPKDLSEDEKTALERLLPWTRLVRPGATVGPRGGPPEDLADIVRRGRSTLVLKPATDYGGRGITLGWEVDQPTWEKAWQEALESRFIVQERAPMRRLRAPWAARDERGVDEFFFDLAPYILDGSRSRGMGVRFSAGALLNVAAGGGSAVPVFYAPPTST